MNIDYFSIPNPFSPTSFIKDAHARELRAFQEQISSRDAELSSRKDELRNLESQKELLTNEILAVKDALKQRFESQLNDASMRQKNLRKNDQ